MGLRRRKHIAMLHYAAPPVVGGVETTLAHHARLLAADGYRVRVVCGRGQVRQQRGDLRAGFTVPGERERAAEQARRALDEREPLTPHDLFRDRLAVVLLELGLVIEEVDL